MSRFNWIVVGLSGLVLLALVCLLVAIGLQIADQSERSSVREAGAAALGAASSPATDTPLPTHTPFPTETPTLEPTPTETPAPLPTETPIPPPTDTPVPLPTDTPVPPPTDTPVPIPTDTPAPTGPLVVIALKHAKDEYVDLQNIGGAAQDLAGWMLRSERGEQDCPLAGVIGPGETLRVWALAEDAGRGGFNCGYGKNIWNNSERDDAVLFNASGVEVDRRG